MHADIPPVLVIGNLRHSCSKLAIVLPLVIWT